MTEETTFHPDFLKAFTALRSAVEHGATFRQGICGVMYDTLERFNMPESVIAAGMDRLTVEVWPCWERFSGSNVFPIPGMADAYGRAAAQAKLWEGEQREHRLALIKFTIAYLEAEHEPSH